MKLSEIVERPIAAGERLTAFLIVSTLLLVTAAALIVLPEPENEISSVASTGDPPRHLDVARRLVVGGTPGHGWLWRLGLRHRAGRLDRVRRSADRDGPTTPQRSPHDSSHD